MNKKIAAFLLSIFLLILCCLSAQASSLSKEERYNAAVEELKKYINGENSMPMDELVKNFDALGRYQMSINLSFYTMVLQKVESNDYARVFELIRMLKMDEDFSVFLEENDLGLLDELENYAHARQEETNGDTEAAIRFYEACIGFMDSMSRWNTIRSAQLDAQYEKAVAWYQEGTYQGYQKAYEAFLALGDFKESAAYLIKADMLRATPVPTPMPTPVPTPVPTPAPKRAWEIQGLDMFEYFEDGNGVTITGLKDSYKNEKYITIPDGVTAIGGRAFYNYEKLIRVTLPSSIKTIGAYAFYKCSALTDITIPEGVVSIGDYAFWECKKLTHLYIPDSVTHLGQRIVNVQYIQKLSIADSLPLTNNPFNTFVSPYTSWGTLPLEIRKTNHPVLEWRNDGLYSRLNDGSVYLVFAQNATGRYTVAKDVTHIGGAAFSCCDELVGITIPDSVISIGDFAFGLCYALTDITIPDSVISIGDSAFSNCYALTDITIPDSVISIGDHAFYNCTGLTAITLPDILINIGGYAFDGCDSLTSVTVIESPSVTYTWEELYGYALYGYKFDGCPIQVIKGSMNSIFVQYLYTLFPNAECIFI